MKAARISAPKTWEVLDIETPTIGDGQCLIKLETWSVCGSDIRHGYGPVHPEEEYPMRMGGPLPRVRRHHRRKPHRRIPGRPARHSPAQPGNHRRPGRVHPRNPGPHGADTRRRRYSRVGHVPALRHGSLLMPEDGNHPRQNRRCVRAGQHRPVLHRDHRPRGGLARS